MTTDRSQKKWMYLSFALMAVIASGILVPGAFATNPTLTDLFNKIVGIDTKVTQIKSQVNSALPETHIIKINQDVTDSLPVFLPAKEGTTYHGHITLTSWTDSAFGNPGILICELPGSTNDGRTVAAFDVVNANLDFSCTSLKWDGINGPSDPIHIYGIIDYVEDGP